MTCRLWNNCSSFHAPRGDFTAKAGLKPFEKRGFKGQRCSLSVVSVKCNILLVFTLSKEVQTLLHSTLLFVNGFSFRTFDVFKRLQTLPPPSLPAAVCSPGSCGPSGSCRLAEAWPAPPASCRSALLAGGSRGRGTAAGTPGCWQGTCGWCWLG